MQREKYCNLKVRKDALSFLLTAESGRREHFTDCDGMLAFGVLCVTCGWRSRSSRSLKGHLTVGTRRLAVDTYISHASVRRPLYPCHSQSVQVLLRHDVYLPGVQFVNVFCNSRPKTMHLQQRFYARTNDASTTFTTNMCGHKMKMLL